MMNQPSRQGALQDWFSRWKQNQNPAGGPPRLPGQGETTNPAAGRVHAMSPGAPPTVNYQQQQPASVTYNPNVPTAGRDFLGNAWQQPPQAPSKDLPLPPTPPTAPAGLRPYDPKTDDSYVNGVGKPPGSYVYHPDPPPYNPPPTPPPNPPSAPMESRYPVTDQVKVNPDTGVTPPADNPVAMGINRLPGLTEQTAGGGGTNQNTDRATRQPTTNPYGGALGTQNTAAFQQVWDNWPENGAERGQVYAEAQAWLRNSGQFRNDPQQDGDQIAKYMLAHQQKQAVIPKKDESVSGNQGQTVFPHKNEGSTSTTLPAGQTSAQLKAQMDAALKQGDMAAFMQYQQAWERAPQGFAAP